MKVAFIPWSTGSVKPFFEVLNWPADLPQIGNTVTFALKSKDPTNNGQQVLATGAVIDVMEFREGYAEIWVDMGDFAQALQDGITEIVKWSGISYAPSQ